MKPKLSSTSVPVDLLVAEVLNSEKYKYFDEKLVRRLATQELSKRSSVKESIKAVKNKIHQVSGAYFDRSINYQYWSDLLLLAQQKGIDDFRSVCQQVMCYHSSTRERQADLEYFYKELLTKLPDIHRVFDVACGLNPLALPWMNLSPDVEYIAVDICVDMVAFLNHFFHIAGVNGKAIVSDVIWSCPPISSDVAFLLKSIPCLEQIDHNAGIRLLDSLQAKKIIVSFPVHSLSGRRDKGMLKNYSQMFTEIAKDRQWSLDTLEFNTELVFVVSKHL